jgi:NADPH-dependent 2,4-dienoyl-CoA reductase/sulfur reductase-like enzyme
MSIAIVGAGLAGTTLAAELRDGGYDGPLVMYGAERHLPYDRPPLSKGVLLGRSDPGSVTLHDPDWYRDHDIDLRTSTEVTAISPGDHLLRTQAGEEPYTTLVLATGSEPRRLPLADESGKPVIYLRTVDDCERLRAALAERPRVTVVGGGWIGLEVAAAAREHGCEVTLHETADLPLLGVLGREVAQVFADLHSSHGVALRLGAPVSPGDLATADLVVVGIGATPRTSLAETAGLDVDNGVLVDAYLRTSHPDILAIGDIARHDHPTLGRIRVEHWDNAIEQAKTAAHTLLGTAKPYDRHPYFFTDQYDLGMEYTGHVGPSGYDMVAIEGDTSAAFQAFWLRHGTVMAAMHANDWDASDRIRASVGRPYPPSR